MPQSKQLTKAKRKMAISGNSLPGRYSNIVQYLDQDEANLLPHDKPVELTADEEKRMRIYFQIFGMLVDGKTSTQVAHRISKFYDISVRYSFMMISEAQQIFVKVKQFDREALRQLQIDRRERLIQQIEADTKLEAADRYKLKDEVWRQIEKIAGLHREKEIDINELADKLIMPQVILSTDANVLDTTYEKAD